MSNIFAEDLARKGLDGPEAAPADNIFAEDLKRKGLYDKPTREQLAAGLERNRAKLAALNAEPDPMSAGQVLGAVGHDLAERGKAIGRGVATVATHPREMLMNESHGGDYRMQREFVRGVDDAVLLGYGRKAGEKLANMAGKTFEGNAEEDAAAAPDVRAAGALTGSFLPSPIKAGAGKVLARTKVGAFAGSGLAPSAARSLVTYGVTAPAAAALHADAGGVMDRLEAAKDAALDPSGQLLAVGGAALARGVGKKAATSRGAQAREFIEREGGGAKVGLFSPGKGGVFDEELAGVPANDKGIGIAARKGAEKILSGIKRDREVETSKPYRQLKAQIDASPEAAQLRDVSPIVENIKAATADLGTDDAVVAKLNHKLDQLERFRQPPDPQAVKAATQQWWKLPKAGRPPLEQYIAENAPGPIMVPEDQLNGLRRSLMRMAKVGTTDAPGEREAPLRAAAFTAKQMVDQGPYAALNELYAEGADKLAGQRKQLGLKPKAPADSGVDLRKLKLTLEREGQNTKTAGGDSDIEGFRQENPKYRTATNLAELQRAKADLSFRLIPQHGGLIDRTIGAHMGPAAMIGSAAFGGPHGALGAAGVALGQNATPLAGRVLYPLSRSTGVNPLVWAAMEERRRQAELAARLRGFGQ